MASTTTASPSSGEVKEKLLEKLQRWGESLVNCWRKCSKSDCSDNKEEENEGSYVSPVENETGRNPKDPPKPINDTFEDPPEDQKPPTSEPVHPRRDTPYVAQLQGYSVYTLKTFPFNLFQAANYESVYHECEKWSAPLQYNYALQEEFLRLLDLEDADEKLKKFSSLLQNMGSILREGKKPPENTMKEFDPVLEKFTQEPDIKMDEIKSLILVTDAFVVYSTRIARKARDQLPADKCQKLISFLISVPYGGGHTFTQKEDYDLYRDPDINYIIIRSGFKHDKHLPNVIYDPPSDNKAGPIGTAFFLLLGTTKNI